MARRASAARQVLIGPARPRQTAWIGASGGPGSCPKIRVLCDFVETRYKEKIKVINNIAAAGVGIAIFVWFIVLGVELSRLLDLALP